MPRHSEPLLRAKGTTWIMDGNVTAPTPAWIPTLFFDQLDAELEKPLLDGQTDREILCQELHCTGNSFIFPAEQPGVICWTEFLSLRICRMVSSPFPQLLSNTSHAMGEQRARNNGQLAAVGLELFNFSVICWDLEPKADECHQTRWFYHILNPLWVIQICIFHHLQSVNCVHTHSSHSNSLTVHPQRGGGNVYTP